MRIKKVIPATNNQKQSLNSDLTDIPVMDRNRSAQKG